MLNEFETLRRMVVLEALVPSIAPGIHLKSGDPVMVSNNRYRGMLAAIELHQKVVAVVEFADGSYGTCPLAFVRKLEVPEATEYPAAMGIPQKSV